MASTRTGRSPDHVGSSDHAAYWQAGGLVGTSTGCQWFRSDSGGSLESVSTGLFGLDREMGYTRREFFGLLPSTLSDYAFAVDGDVVTVAMGAGTVHVRVGIERERRFTDLVRFPILPVTLEFNGVDQQSQARFMRRFDLSYMKGLG